jgi:cytosine/adenosine deaminase-related metal-dependent hydrolase
MYIEDTLPDISMLSKAGVHICIGTDSLASNHQLDIMSELCVIKQHYPNIGWEQLLNWGTYNGAKALQFDTLLGSFAVGKQPGVLLLSSLSDEYTIKRLA